MLFNFLIENALIIFIIIWVVFLYIFGYYIELEDTYKRKYRNEKEELERIVRKRKVLGWVGFGLIIIINVIYIWDKRRG